jgi:hypothetical protein
MKISVNYEDTDVAKALGTIIYHPNKDEFVKLLTPILCGSSDATNYFFKLLIGDTLPEVIPNGTLCKIKVDRLGYSSNKDEIRKKFADDEDKVLVTVKEFRGYHEYSQYHIEYGNVLSDSIVEKDTTYVSAKELEVIEEF